MSWKRKDGSDVPGLSFGDPENPTVVVIQEWWGLDDSVKAHAKLIADRGYHAVVPDLYRGEVGVEVTNTGTAALRCVVHWRSVPVALVVCIRAVARHNWISPYERENASELRSCCVWMA